MHSNLIGSCLKGVAAACVAVLSVSGSAFGVTRNVPSDYSTVEAAIAAAEDNDEIVIGTGTYELAAEISVARPLTIRSATGKPEDVTLKPANSASRIAVMNHASARLESLTMTGAAFSGEGGAISIDAKGGVIANCVIYGCKSTGWGSSGGAITMNSADAIVTDCVFSNNVSHTDANTYGQSCGMSIRLKSGKVRNSLFVRHNMPSCAGVGGVIFMTGGEVENCTVALNSHPSASGIYADGGTVRNCLIVGNVCTVSAYEGHGDVWAGKSSCFTNCIAPLFINDNCILANRIVRNCAAGDLTPIGAAVDTGVTPDWQEGALDLAGRARVIGAAIDLGCYECDRTADPLNVTADRTQGIAPLTVVFTPDAFGLGGATIEWDWNDDGTFDAESTGPIDHEFAAGRQTVNARIKDTAIMLVAPIEIVALPKNIYVDPDCASPLFPYGDAEHAATSINEAYDVAVDGCEIVLVAKAHTLDSTIVYSKGVTIRGETGDPKDVTVTPKSSANRFAVMNNASACFAGLTLKSAQFKGEGGGISIDAGGGIVSNCVMHSCKSTAWGSCGGAIGMNSADALVTHCVFSNNTSDASGNLGDGNQGRGMAIRIRNGKVRNSLFIHNDMSSAGGLGGAVYLQKGEIENCTVALNKHPYCAGICATGGKVRNCIIVGNTCTSSYDGHGEVWAGTASCFEKCIAPLYINDVCTNVDRIVQNYADGDLTPVGAAIDSGAETDWQTGATDLAGNPRVSGEAIDLGCYEYDQSQVSIGMTTGKTRGFAPLTVQFTPTVFGAAGSVVEWDWDGDGVFEEETAGETTHEFEAGRWLVNARVKGTDVTLEVPVEITSLPKTLFVDPDCASSQFPYADAEHAAKTVEEAFASVEEGGEIVLVPKTHVLADTITFSKGVTIRGATGNPADVTLMPQSSAKRIAVMNNASARFESLTLTGGKYPGDGGGISILSGGGTVSNCVMHGCSSADWGKCGGAIAMDSASALVTHCVFSNNVCDTSCNPISAVQGRGMAIFMKNGKVRNSLFIRNVMTSSAAAGGVISMSGGEVDNCTVALNAHPYGAGIFATGGTVRNTVFVGNSCTTPYEGHGEVWNGKASCFEKCIASVDINDTCIVSDRIVRDCSAEDLTPVGATIDAGLPTVWQEDATDLAGNDRVSGKAIDLGCYEYDQSQVSIDVTVDKVQGLAPLTVKFTPKAFGAAGSAIEWDWDGDGTFEDETAGETTHEFAAGRHSVNARIKGSDVTLAVPLEIAALSKTLFVDPDCATPQFPYADWDHAATSLEEAYGAAIDGCAIVLAAKEHVVADTIGFSKAATIRGATGNPADVTVKPMSTSKRIAIMNNASARFEALTLTGGKFPGEGGCVSIISGGGVVSNCVMCGCKSDTWGACGGALAMDSADALATHCVFSNNVCDANGNGPNYSGRGGMAVCLRNGKVRNSLFVGNGDNTTHNNPGGAIYVVNGEVDNCTFVGNKHTYCAGVYATGGIVRNCLIAGNVCTASYQDCGEVWNGSASCFEKCLGDGEERINDTCFVDEAAKVFRLRGTRPYDILPDSQAVNNGELLPWMAGATDFFGRPRVSRKLPDIGCCECLGGGFRLIVR